MTTPSDQEYLAALTRKVNAMHVDIKDMQSTINELMTILAPVLKMAESLASGGKVSPFAMMGALRGKHD